MYFPLPPAASAATLLVSSSMRFAPIFLVRRFGHPEIRWRLEGMVGHW